jgi:hypothetical protein
MKEILRNEGTTAVRRAKLVNAFNDGYRGYRRTYRTCTQSATLATTRFSTEGASIAASLAQGSTFASKGQPEAKPEGSPEANKDGARLESGQGTVPEANKAAKPGLRPKPPRPRRPEMCQGPPPKRRRSPLWTAARRWKSLPTKSLKLKVKN